MFGPIFGIIETFNWTSEDGETKVSFPVTRMLRDIKKSKLPVTRITTAIDRDFIRNWLVHRNIKIDRCHTMSAVRRKEPVLGAWMPDEAVLLIDGSHRYLARFIHRETTIDYNLVAEQDWKPYATIEGKWPPV